VLIILHGRSALLIDAFAVGGVLHQLHRVEMLRALLQSSIAATRRGTTSPFCFTIGRVHTFFFLQATLFFIW
jgi:hypothetical protein